MPIDALLIFYYATQVALYQTALSRPASDISTLEKQDFKHVQLLYSCLQATKSVFDLIFSLDRKYYFYFSLITWSSLRFALIGLQQLSVFEDPEWDLNYVRDTLDFLWVLDELYARFEKAAAELNFDEEHVFPRTAKKMRLARAYCQERMAAPMSRTERGNSDYEDLPLLDDLWFQDVFGMLECQPNATGIPDM